MPTKNHKPDLFDTEQGAEIIKALMDMVADESFHTQSSYSANSKQYPDNLKPFVEQHVEYLRRHPAVNPLDYLANLRLMTRRK